MVNIIPTVIVFLRTRGNIGPERQGSQVMFNKDSLRGDVNGLIVRVNEEV